jgi:Flp pilus assembly protein TadB
MMSTGLVLVMAFVAVAGVLIFAVPIWLQRRADRNEQSAKKELDRAYLKAAQHIDRVRLTGEEELTRVEELDRDGVVAELRRHAGVRPKGD